MLTQLSSINSVYFSPIWSRVFTSDLLFVRRCLDEDLKLISKIPLLPALLDSNDEERARVEICCDKSKPSDMTLFNWIRAKDPEQSLESVVQECRDTLIKVRSLS